MSDCTGCQNPVQSDTPRDPWNVSDCTGCQNLSNPTHQGTLGMWRISTGVRILYNPTHSSGPLECDRISTGCQTSCTIRHTKVQRNVSDCTGFWHPVQSDHIPLVPWNVIGIVQDVWTCLIRHTKGPLVCRISTGCQTSCLSDTPRDQRNVSDCTGCQNLYNPTHSKGPEECDRIVQDVWHPV